MANFINFGDVAGEDICLINLDNVESVFLQHNSNFITICAGANSNEITYSSAAKAQKAMSNLMKYLGMNPLPLEN